MCVVSVALAEHRGTDRLIGAATTLGALMHRLLLVSEVRGDRSVESGLRLTAHRLFHLPSTNAAMFAPQTTRTSRTVENSLIAASLLVCSRALASFADDWHDQEMTELPKYIRVVLEFEVEVTDPMKVQTRLLELAADKQGIASSDSEETISMALMQAVSPALMNNSEETGLFASAIGVLHRKVGPDGAYEAMELPSMPRRLDDGTRVWPADMPQPE